ncbi:glr3643 [Gloeobacter violaceus PCC 7421]|uniref:Glr3643 protein n=1 Tax=Gloeobacter violaceus (strain ATCC 29082 / PCC 7421) TaxID=251221 RepID=Q7NF83_GLOVI|nr:glr3643 [Gloeobacter violaceus PCC 7421]
MLIKRVFVAAVVGVVVVGALLWYRLVSAVAQSAVGDVLVSDLDIDLIDPEFDQAFDRFTWVDNQGKVWIGKVDPKTGNFTPPSGQSVLIDTGAAPTELVGNGPEWVYTSSGAQIVYTRYEEGRLALARARFDNGNWTAGLLEAGSGRYAPLGSLDEGDGQPRISYVGRNEERKLVTFWRHLDNPDSEAEVPGSEPPGGRWVEGMRSIVLTQKVGTGRQGFLYNVDTQILEQLTFDAGVKKTIIMWKAPEYNNEYLFFVLINETNIGVYRKTSGTWKKIYTVDPPSKGEYLWSPEVFVHNGKSYIFMVTSTSRDQKSKTIPTDIWLAGIDSTSAFYRRISDTTERVRKDPEVYITELGPFVYFLDYIEPQSQATAIYRADTGLGPAN